MSEMSLDEELAARVTRARALRERSGRDYTMDPGQGKHADTGRCLCEKCSDLRERPALAAAMGRFAHALKG